MCQVQVLPQLWALQLFSPSSGLSFFSCHSIFQISVCNIYEIQFISFFFFVIDYPFGVRAKKYLPNTRSQRFSSYIGILSFRLYT